MRVVFGHSLFFSVEEPSLWDQLEGKVKREVRQAMSTFLHLDVSAKLRLYRTMLKEFAYRGKAISANPQTDAEDIKSFINDLKIHFDNTRGDIHKFNFNHFKGE